MAPCDQAFLRQGQTLKGGRVTQAEGDIDSIEGLWRIPLFDGGEAGMTEEVVRAIQGTGIQPGRGCGVGTEWQQQRVFNGKSNSYHIFFPWVQLQQTCGLGNVEEADERSPKKRKRRSTATVRAVLQEEPLEELLEELVISQEVVLLQEWQWWKVVVKAQQLELGLSSCRLRKPLSA